MDAMTSVRRRSSSLPRCLGARAPTHATRDASWLLEVRLFPEPLSRLARTLWHDVAFRCVPIRVLIARLPLRSGQVRARCGSRAGVRVARRGRFNSAPSSAIFRAGRAPSRSFAVSLALVVLAAASSGARASCADVVGEYWGALAQGNLPAALKFTSASTALSWPGDEALLPMAGRWMGPSGITQFFTVVSTYFNFQICDGPHIYALPNTTSAYAIWTECSVLRATGLVHCPNAINQALYACDPATGLLGNITVNIDNACVADAICVAGSASSGLQCRA